MLFFTTVHLSTGWLMPVKVVILPEYVLDMARLIKAKFEKYIANS